GGGGSSMAPPPRPSRRESGDIVVRGLWSSDAPVLIEGLNPNTAYSFHYYVALPAQLPPEALGEAVWAAEDPVAVDKKRYVGRSLILTPNLQRSVSNAGDAAAGAKTPAGKGTAGAAGTGSGSPPAAMPSDEGVIENDIAGSATAGDGHTSAGGTMSPGSVQRVASGSPGSPISRRLRGGVGSPGNAASPRDGHLPADLAATLADDVAHAANDEAKQAAINTWAMLAFRETNPCTDATVRNVAETGAELCFATDFKRAADRVAHRRQYDDTIAERLPNFIFEQLTRADVMQRASHMRRSVPFLFCLRVLELPRGEFSATDAMWEFFASHPKGE
ncbi:MAG: hypothetical protein Q8S13_04065, partial [Dehalococcoidia bacterium]|nr:hypothetical protein [Dehalococcoidia bacterium]